MFYNRFFYNNNNNNKLFIKLNRHTNQNRWHRLF